MKQWKNLHVTVLLQNYLSDGILVPFDPKIQTKWRLTPNFISAVLINKQAGIKVDIYIPYCCDDLR